MISDGIQSWRTLTSRNILFCEWLWNLANVGKWNFAIFHNMYLQMNFSSASNATCFIIFKTMGANSNVKESLNALFWKVKSEALTVYWMFPSSVFVLAECEPLEISD